MGIAEWIIWGVACGYVVLAFIAFLVAVFKLNPFPEGPERRLSPNARKVVAGLTTLLGIVALIVTAATSISKFQ